MLHTLNWATLSPILLYLVAMFLVAFSLRHLKQEGTTPFMEEYFIGSREMGGWVLALTLIATYTSGSSFLGGPGLAYSKGLGWVLLSVIQVPTALLTLAVLGKRFAVISRKINAVTLNDFLRARYEHPAVVLFASLSLIIFSTAALSAQFIAGARLLEVATHLPYQTALILFAGSVIIYTTFGGFRAVVLTDVLQGAVMLVGTFLLLFITIKSGGGVPHIMQTLESIDPGLITPYGPNEGIQQPFILSFWILVCFGVIGLPSSAVRCMGYRNSAAMRHGAAIGTIVLTLIMLGMHLNGVFARVLLPDISVVDLVIPRLALHVLPPVWAGFFLAAPLAAIMSSVDSQLILASSALVKDVYLNYCVKSEIPKDRTLALFSLATTFAVGILAFLFAINPPSLIVWINLFAFGGLQATFLLPTLFGLYWRRANAYGALASMLAGCGAFLFFSQRTSNLWGVHAIVPTVLFAALAFLIVSLMTQPPKGTIVQLFWGETGDTSETID